jgi:hypothetical protein
MWCNPVKALAVVSVGLWSIPLVYAQGALSFDDRRAQLEAQTELVAKELALQDALRRLAAPRQAGLPTIVAIMGLEGQIYGALAAAQRCRLIFPRERNHSPWHGDLCDHRKGRAGKGRARQGRQGCCSGLCCWRERRCRSRSRAPSGCTEWTSAT